MCKSRSSFSAFHRSKTSAAKPRTSHSRRAVALNRSTRRSAAAIFAFVVIAYIIPKQAGERQRAPAPARVYALLRNLPDNPLGRIRHRVGFPGGDSTADVGDGLLRRRRHRWEVPDVRRYYVLAHCQSSSSSVTHCGWWPNTLCLPSLSKVSTKPCSHAAIAIPDSSRSNFSAGSHA